MRIERTIRPFDDREIRRAIANPPRTITADIITSLLCNLIIVVIFVKDHNLGIILAHKLLSNSTLAVLSCDAVAINLSFGETVTQLISF